MITFKNSFFYLHTEKTSYVMRLVGNRILTSVYYGARIKEDNLKAYSLMREIAFATKVPAGDKEVSAETIPQEMPTFGRGDFRLAAIEVATPDGRRVNQLEYVSHKIIKGKPRFEGMPQLDVNVDDVDTLEIVMRDEISGFEATLSYSVFEKENVIARRTDIKNISRQTLKIASAASAAIDFESRVFDMVTLKGGWAKERSAERYPLHQGISSVESRRGSSSHHLNPFAALCSREATEDFGDVYGFTLVYSADFKISVESDQFDSVRVIIGINPETFEWTLAPGESFTTPEALLTYSAEGFCGMSHAFHSVCRNHLGKCADDKLVHPIVINNWEAMYFSLNEEKINKFINDCAGLGIDTMVLDDGWFGRRDNDDSSLGDWFVDKKKFPNGLGGIIETCRKNNMKFGIWFEPEMVSPDSELFRTHPDWCIHVKGRQPIEARQQLILDMSRKEVVGYLFESISKILSEYDISYVKWDMNRNITDNGSDWLYGRQGEHAHRYILGVYELMDRLTKAYPDVFFEGCSGGGGRFDFGILYYMPQIWTSDDSDAIERLRIQYGTSYVYPPSTMVAHVSACPNHQTGRVTPFKTRGEVAQMCNFGYELDVGLLSEEERKQIISQTAKHRELEDLIKNGRYFRLLNPFEGKLCAWELVSGEKDKAFVTLVSVQKTANDKGFYLKLKGLDPDAVYTVSQMDTTLYGATLMNVGIPIIPPLGEYESRCFDIVKK